MKILKYQDDIAKNFFVTDFITKIINEQNWPLKLPG
jgi:hypothetical protein